MINDNILERRSLSGKSQRFFMCIAGTTFSIISQDTDFLRVLRERYQHYEATGSAEFEIMLQLAPPSTICDRFDIPPARRFIRTSVSKMKTGCNYLIKQTTKPFLALTNIETKKVLIKTCRSQSAFHSFLRTLFALILTQRKGLLVRAAAVSENHRASLFYGSRYLRKTMINQVLPEADILTDGFVAIRPHNNHFRVYSTPFQNECISSAQPVRARLETIYLLKKDHSCSVIQMQGGAPLLALFRNSAFFTDDSELLNNLWNNCRQIIKIIPSYEAHFCPGKSFVQSTNEFSLARLISRTAVGAGHKEGIGIGR